MLGPLHPVIRTPKPVEAPQPEKDAGARPSHLNNNVKLGIGYNSGSFTDDLRGVTQNDEGCFLNLVAKFRGEAGRTRVRAALLQKSGNDCAYTSAGKSMPRPS